MSNSANITWTMRLKKYTRLTAVSILMLVKILSLATRFPTSQKSPRPLLGHLTFLLFNRSLHDLSHLSSSTRTNPTSNTTGNRSRDLPDLNPHVTKSYPTSHTTTAIYPTSTTTAGVYPTSSWTKHNNNKDLPDLKQVKVSQRFIQT